MKNKISFLIFVFTANFLFANSAYCQPTINDSSSPEPYIDSTSQNSNCGVNDAYSYFSLGVGPIVFIPNLGVGYRERHSQFGWDTALSFSTVGFAHQLSAYLVGHYYLSPLQKSSAYLGLGIMGGGVFTNHKGNAGILSPDFVFGRQLEKSGDSKHFIEMHVDIPSLWISSEQRHLTCFPLMYIKYGIAF